MADSKITALTSISTSTDPAVDPLVIVDVSDTSMAATGTTKKVTLNNLLSSSPTATGAFSVTGLVTAGSATITGDLTVRSGNKLILNRADNAASTQLNDQGSGIGFVLNNVNGDGILFKVAGNSVYQVGSSYVQTWYDGAGGTRMTLNSTGLGIGVSPAYSIQSYGTAPAIATGGTTTMSSAGQIGASFILRSESTSIWTGTREMVSFDSVGNGADHRAGSLSIKLKATSGASSLTEYLLINPTYGYSNFAVGNLGLGVTTFGTSAARVLSIGTGTEPTTGPAGSVQFFTSTRSASNTIPAIFTEGSGVTNAGITSTTVTNKIAIKVNGTIYYLLATTSAA